MISPVVNGALNQTLVFKFAFSILNNLKLANQIHYLNKNIYNFCKNENNNNKIIKMIKKLEVKLKKKKIIGITLNNLIPKL